MTALFLITTRRRRSGKVCMPDRQIKFYYKNVLADVIGCEHGITTDQLDELAKRISPLVPKIKDEITGGKTRYGLLPPDTQTPKQVKK